MLLLVGATLGSGAQRPARWLRTRDPDSSSVDAGFARDMIVHHDQGVLMAHYAEQNTTDHEIEVMAYDIGYTQTDQIGQMQGWLSLWDLPDSSTAPRMGWMGGTGADHGGMDMGSAAPPGTASARLRACRGRRRLQTASGQPLMPGHGHRRRDRQAEGPDRRRSPTSTSCS